MFEGLGDDELGVLLDLLQVVGAVVTFGVDFVDVFGAGGASGAPAAFGYQLQAADGLVVAGGAGEDVLDGFAGESCGFDVDGFEIARIFFCCALAGASMRA